MSAICGLIRFDGLAIDREPLDRLHRAQSMFGQDAEGILAHDAIGLGHRLRRVTFEDQWDTQPIYDRDAALTIVADLRIDNRAELIQALHLDPATCAEWPDSAFIAPAYVRWGADLVQHLIGDFAFAIWDASARKLLLARDHMGQRSLFYTVNEEQLAFATDMVALEQLDNVASGIAEAALAQILTLDFSRAAPGETYVAGVMALEKACVMTVTGQGAIAIENYWKPKPAPQHLGQSDGYYQQAYRQVLSEAVSCRLRRLDGRPALMLSGAFDSGAIAGLAGSVAAENGTTLLTVTSALPPGESCSRSPDARKAVELFRPFSWIDIHYHDQGERGLLDTIDTQFAQHGLSGANIYLHRKLVEVAAAGKARLMMDGYGGDYTLHVRSRAMLGQLLGAGKPLRFVREFHFRRRVTGLSALQVIARDVAPALLPGWILRRWDQVGGRRRPPPTFIAAAFYDRMVAQGKVGRRRAASSRRGYRAEMLHALSLAETSVGVRKLCLEAGMEFTRPFHDKRVVELALAMPIDLHFRDGRERWLPRMILKDILPQGLRQSMAANTPFRPDFITLVRDEAPKALQQLRELDHTGRVAQLIDLDAICASLGDIQTENPNAVAAAARAITALKLGRYLAWAKQNNQ